MCRFPPDGGARLANFHLITMKHYKLDFANRSALEQVAICRRVADSVAKLPAEHQAALAGVGIAAATNEAADACAAVEAAKAALKAARHLRQTKLSAARDCAYEVGLKLTSLTGGQPAAFLAAGLGVVRPKQPVGVPSAPDRLRVLVSEFEGRLKLRWQRPVRRCAFLVQMTTDPAALTGWQQVAISGNRQSCEVTGLPSGKKHWFRVCAVNAHGQSAWSQPVSAWVK